MIVRYGYALKADSSTVTFDRKLCDVLHNAQSVPRRRGDIRWRYFRGRTDVFTRLGEAERRLGPGNLSVSSQFVLFTIVLFFASSKSTAIGRRRSEPELGVKSDRFR
ncbi:hypothetical protein K449DRAFT_224246 [Hypoxylon sp. EC38]|nr:hypothetical protein K449DRAFT_224246 [Hypoxylon sp. EC38]